MTKIEAIASDPRIIRAKAQCAQRSTVIMDRLCKRISSAVGRPCTAETVRDILMLANAGRPRWPSAPAAHGAAPALAADARVREAALNAGRDLDALRTKADTWIRNVAGAPISDDEMRELEAALLSQAR